jgi:hypothetical protein
VGTTNPSSFIVQTAGSVGPNATNTYDLGSASLEWRNLYVQNVVTPSAGTGQFGYWQRNLDSTSNLYVLASNNTADTLAIGLTSPLHYSGLEVDGDSKGNALAVLNETGGGPVFTASVSGAAKVMIANNGSLIVGNPANTGRSSAGLVEIAQAQNTFANIGASSDYFINIQNTDATDGNGAGIAFSDTSATDAVGGAIIFKRTGGASRGELQFYTKNSIVSSDAPLEAMVLTQNQQVGIGANLPVVSNATSLGATLDVRPNSINGGTLAVASVSGKTAFAGLVVDNSGAGDLFTASSSGLNRFVITQAGNVGYWDNVPKKRHH